MDKLTLIEIIFKGKLEKVNLNFIQYFLTDSVKIRFNYPENVEKETYESICELFLQENYIDMVIITKKFSLCNFSDKNLFINIGLDDNQIELLLFLDIKDIISTDLKEGINKLKEWAYDFFKNFSFEDMVCKMDGEDYDNNYFSKDGDGPLMNKI